MMNIVIDFSNVSKTFENLGADLEKAANQAASELAPAIYGHLLEEANSKLHSRRKMFIDALSFKQESDRSFTVTLDKKAVWIDDGMCVVYGKSPNHIPKVLTPDGLVSVTEIKPGHMVMNALGKWTEVLFVHDRFLWDWCQEDMDEQETLNSFGYLASSLSKSSHKPVVMRCRSCDGTRVAPKKQDICRPGKPPFCHKCASENPLISIERDRDGYKVKLVLTGDHQVLTPDGWITADELSQQSKQKMMTPKWGKCQGCDSKVLLGVPSFCSSSCAARAMNLDKLSKGTHVSQDPEWMKNVYFAKVANGKRISKAEDLFAQTLEKMGYTVGFSGSGCDWIRQQAFDSPNRDKANRKRYFWPDFYNEKLKLILEVDGQAFHSGATNVERDRKRDLALIEKYGVQIIRLPAKLGYKPRKLRETLEAILANHEEEVELEPVKVRAKRLTPGRSNPFSRAWDITVADGSSFVCQEMVIHNSEHEMLTALLKSPKAKTSASGDKYIVVPFDHSPGKGASSTTPAQQDLISTIKKDLKKKAIPFGKIEKDPSGQPKIGNLHRLDIMNSPLKTHNGPGQGKGRIGDVKQGPTGIPFLQGIQISQKPKEGGGVKRNISTFRVASSKMKGTGRWVHPGLEPTDLMKEAYEWGLKHLDDVILPRIFSQILGR